MSNRLFFGKITRGQEMSKQRLYGLLLKLGKSNPNESQYYSVLIM